MPSNVDKKYLMIEENAADKFSFKNSNKKEDCEPLIMIELTDVNCCCYFINEQGEDTETSMD